MSDQTIEQKKLPMVRYQKTTEIWTCVCTYSSKFIFYTICPVTNVFFNFQKTQSTYKYV